MKEKTLMRRGENVGKRGRAGMGIYIEAGEVSLGTDGLATANRLESATVRGAPERTSASGDFQMPIVSTDDSKCLFLRRGKISYSI